MFMQSQDEPAILKPLLAGGLMFALVGLLMDLQNFVPFERTAHGEEVLVCEGDRHSDARLSRQQIAQLLTIPERDSRDRVESLLQQPYCQLPDLEVRAGVVAQRQAYPLEFDPQTWLVILYEGDEYAGFRFSFR
jgi:hypothetical protein